MELHLGKMTSKELAEWFGIAYSTYRKTTKKKLEILKAYCEYTRVRGGVEISKIHQAEYVKDPTTYEIIKQEVKEKWIREEPETVTRVAARILESGAVALNLDRCRRYVGIARNELWGHPKIEGNHGEIGWSKYVWVKMYRGAIVAENEYQFLTEKDKEIYHQIRVKYYGNEEEKADLAKSLINDKVMTKAQAWDYVHGDIESLQGLNHFKAYLVEVSQALDCDWLVRATYVEDGQFFEIDLKDLENPFYGVPTNT